MITPTSITKFDRSDAELEMFWIFCLLVAGKNSDWAAGAVLRLLSHRGIRTPFEYLRENENELHNLLVAHKVGQYGRLERAIKQSLSLDLRTATLDELVAVFGVGPKTARMFLLHSRRDAMVAVLDVHILRWMREECGMDDSPTQTPPMTGGQYSNYIYWEAICLSCMQNRFPNVPVAEVDLMLWAKMSGRV